jgi:predicted phage tail component-like protein
MKVKARLTNWQLSPSLRNSFVTVPGKHGVADFGADSAGRYIIVKCDVFPQRDFAELVSVMDGVAEWLDPSRGLGELILDDVPDRYFMARLSEVVDCERLIRSAGRFDLKFVCPDPYAYALTDETYTAAAMGSHTVTHLKGSAASEPVYSLKGAIPSGASTYISLITNGAELRVVGALASGETLVIDSGMVTAPHLHYPQFMDDADPAQRKDGLRFALILLCKTDEVWVFGERMSEGMKREIEKARAKNIPVKFFSSDCGVMCT